MNYRLTSIFLLAALWLFFSSCKNAWTQEDKDTFMGGCINGARKDMSIEKAQSYCSCMLQKLQKRFPDAGDMKYVKSDTAVYSMARDCMK